MKVLVTGAAGFIGSHLCQHLLSLGHEVVGIDAMLTDKRIRLQNLEPLLRTKNPRFALSLGNLLDSDLDRLLQDVEAVFHLAGIPGVRSSWGGAFSRYVANNILATQRLLEVCKRQPLKRFVYASTSSVYGERTGKLSETAAPSPLSPYAVSKLAGEHLCRVYEKSEGVPVVILRYFTVYGPRQRPDMAFHRFIYRMLKEMPVPIYGDGHQTRDFTYIDDCVRATAAALNADGAVGQTINIGGGERSSVREVVALLEKLLKQPANTVFSGQAKGEPSQTWADRTLAERLLGWRPTVTLETGLKAEIADLRRMYGEEN